MKTILEYIINNHITRNHIEDYLVDKINKAPKNYAKLSMGTDKEQWFRYIKYEDLYNISKNDLKMFLYEKYNSLVNAGDVKRNAVPTIQYFSDMYGDYITGYYINIEPEDIKIKTNITTLDKNSEYNKLSEYMTRNI